MTNAPTAVHWTLRALRATALVATLMLGGAFHFLHHLQDPACDTSSERTNHVCVACSGLHGSTLVAAATQAPAPGVAIRAQAAPASFASLTFASRGQATPRAPPAS